MDMSTVKVLYAEDEDHLREVMVKVLRLKIDNLYTAKDGEKAYELYKTKKPDIIIADINMPKLNGIDLVKKIRQTDHATRVIMLTSHASLDCLLHSTELKLTKYLLKPASSDKVYEAIQLACDELKRFKITNIEKFTINSEYSWDFNEKSLFHHTKEIHLTPKERDILQLLFSNLNATITYEMFINEVWEDSDIYGVDTIKTMIKNLRKKLPKGTISNVYGIGFKVIHT
jgi:DNA-binding response OmpR family regulator